MQELVNITEMARILGVRKNWLYQRTRRGTKIVPYVRAGKYLRFVPDDVMAALRQNEGRIGD